MMANRNYTPREISTKIEYSGGPFKNSPKND